MYEESERYEVQEKCEDCGRPWPTHKAYCPQTASGQMVKKWRESDSDYHITDETGQIFTDMDIKGVQ